MDLHQRKQIMIGKIPTSDIEIKDLIKAWIAISIAFAIVMRGSFGGLDFYSSFIIASLTVGVGFLQGNR